MTWESRAAACPKALAKIIGKCRKSSAFVAALWRLTPVGLAEIDDTLCVQLFVSRQLHVICRTGRDCPKHTIPDNQAPSLEDLKSDNDEQPET